MAKKYEIHIISHTHWDREWYATFQVYRMRLVKLVDKLLDIFRTIPEYKYFVFDGQTVVLEDYLEIRPEKKDEIKKYVKENKLWIGPWYILPDEFLSSGEATIRNLLFGHKISQEFGRVMKVGYIPDSFGHISQLPQILKGFGIDSAIFTRGLGDEGDKLGSEFIWESPDGSQILAIRQIGGYCNAVNLGYSVNKTLDLKVALDRSIKLKTNLANYARTKYLLFNNGCDHVEPQPEMPEIIRYLNENLEDAEVIHSHFEDLVKKIKDSQVKLEILRGELRSARYSPLLPGVLSSRMYLKQTNERVQTKIEKYAEPLATFAYLEGNKYPQEFFNQAWKYLLQCHPHDSICGCSIDAVHEDVMRRFSWADEISSQIQRQSLEYLSQKIDTSSSGANFIPLIIFNTLNWERNEPVKINLIYSNKEKLKDIPQEYVVQDEEGNCLPVQSGKISDQEYDVLLLRKVYRQEISFLAEKVPPCGYKTYFLLPLTTKRKKNIIKSKSNALKINKNSLENEYYQVKVNRNGTLKIKDKTNGLIYNRLHIFEDTEDAGDEYNYSPAKKSKKILTTSNTKIKTSIYERGPITVTLKIEMDLFLPESLTANRKSRSKKLIKCNLQTLISLHSGVKRIDFKTIFDNRAKDHRLRVLFPTDFKTKYSFAEGQFTVNRRSIDLPTGENWAEKPSPIHPQQSFAHINDGKRGLTVINQGLPEYEAIKTTKGTTLALTLLRCIGWLSRDDLLTRKGHAGPAIPTDYAQCIGRQEFKYSLVIHPGDWEEAKIWQKAYEHNIPLIGIMAKQHAGILPKKLSFVNIEPESVVMSALKKSERNDNIIIRFYNIGSVETTVKIKVYKKPQRIQLVNLNEEPIEGTINSISGNIFEISCRPFQIITVEMEF